MMTRKHATKRTIFLGGLLVALSFTGLTGVATANGSEEPCQAIDYNAQSTGSNIQNVANCLTTSWDADSEQACLPQSYGDDDSTGRISGEIYPSCGIGGSAFDGGDPKCGAGWAQFWQVKVELHEGDAEVTGFIKCNDKKMAECTTKVGGVRVCRDDGGSERGPIECDYVLGEVVNRPLKGVIKCTDPLDPRTFIVKGFELLGVEPPDLS